MRLWLVRHAATVAPPGLCYGRLDVPADPAATAACAAQLAQVLPAALQVACSPRSRCTALADALHRLRPDLSPVVQDDRLAEMDFGAWEGRRWDDIGAMALAQWTDDFLLHAPGGAQNVTQFMATVAAAFDETVAGGADTAWFTHAGVIRAVWLLARGIRAPQPGQWPTQSIAPGCWTWIDLD